LRRAPFADASGMRPSCVRGLPTIAQLLGFSRPGPGGSLSAWRGCLYHDQEDRYHPPDPMSAPVFISFSSHDRKAAETICKAVEQRGLECWVSSRNIGPGENFQEAITRAIRSAKVMILVFSANANNSLEVKKEIALAG